MLYPVYENVRMSVHDVNIKTFLAANQPWAGLDNFRTLFNDPEFWHSVRLSLIFTAGSIAFQFSIGFALAMLFVKPFPGDQLSARAHAAGLAHADRGQRQPLPLGARWRLRHSQLRADRSPHHGRKQYWLIDSGTALGGTILANIWVGIPVQYGCFLLGGTAGNLHRPLRSGSASMGQIGWQRFLVVDAAVDAAGFTERVAARTHLHLQSVRSGLHHDRRRSGQCDHGASDLHLPEDVPVVPVRHRRCRRRGDARRIDDRRRVLRLVHAEGGTA